MNRNYLPPALKLHSSNNAGQHSPPTVAQCPANTNPSTMLTARRTFGSRACKLPTVQEQVGKLCQHRFFIFIFSFSFSFSFLFTLLFVFFLFHFFLFGFCFFFYRNHNIFAGWFFLLSNIERMILKIKELVPCPVV